MHALNAVLDLTPEEIEKIDNIICRCEKVTESEIVGCLHRGIPVVSTDSVKKRTRYFLASGEYLTLFSPKTDRAERGWDNVKGLIVDQRLPKLFLGRLAFLSKRYEGEKAAGREAQKADECLRREVGEKEGTGELTCSGWTSRDWVVTFLSWEDLPRRQRTFIETLKYSQFL
jgi:hypothetical protein